MFRSALIFLCLLTLPLRANLGETVAQCVARYGKPVGFSEAGAKNPFGTLVFSATGYTLVVFLLNTREVGARVSKSDKSEFAPAEMQNIMSADTGGSAWTPTTSDDPSTLRWIRADKATVLYDKEKHVVIFTSLEMANALHGSSPPPTTASEPASSSAPDQAPAPAPVIPPRTIPVAPAPPTQWPTASPAPAATNAAPAAP
jgi:hypothetical protein